MRCTYTRNGIIVTGKIQCKMAVSPNRRMAKNGSAPPLGNFADISYLVEN